MARRASAIAQWVRTRQRGGITLLFTGFAAILTWPHVLVLKTHALDHQDVYFNLWRLRWIAHALGTSPASLFDGNIFHPERGVLAYSDAILLEGVLAAPMLWAGMPPVLVHNVMMLAGIVGSGVGAFVLARHVTGATAPSIAAGIIFAFAPYRFEHYMHLELQWTVWSPWALWALQRTIETGGTRFGLLTGLFVVLQTLSSVYYGVFLSVLVAVVGLCQLIALRGRPLLRAGRACLAGGALAAVLAGAYSIPYSAAAARVGTRSLQEIQLFSARPRDYRVATSTNLLYGSRYPSVAERQLSPGMLAPLLALVGLLLRPPTLRAVAYVIGLVVAFELSLGAYGNLYPWLYEHVNVFRGMRAPARAAVFCLLFLGVLAARGTAALMRSAPGRLRPIVAPVVCGILLLEYWVAPLHLVPYHNEPPPLYALLARLPPGVIAEFPMPAPEGLPGEDPRFSYLSTFHWRPLVNGYSGFYPRSYLNRLGRVSNFPDARSVSALRSENVRYVVVHHDRYAEGEPLRIVERLVRLGLSPIADMHDGTGVATLFELK